MKRIKLILSLLLLLIIVIFSIQNLEIVTVRLFNWSLSLPKALVVILAYLLGMMTGGMTASMFRALFRTALPAEEKEGS